MSIVKSYSFPEGDIRGDMFYIKHGSRNFTVTLIPQHYYKIFFLST